MKGLNHEIPAAFPAAFPPMVRTQAQEARPWYGEAPTQAILPTQRRPLGRPLPDERKRPWQRPHDAGMAASPVVAMTIRRGCCCAGWKRDWPTLPAVRPVRPPSGRGTVSLGRGGALVSLPRQSGVTCRPCATRPYASVGAPWIRARMRVRVAPQNPRPVIGVRIGSRAPSRRLAKLWDKISRQDGERRCRVHCRGSLTASLKRLIVKLDAVRFPSLTHL